MNERRTRTGRATRAERARIARRERTIHLMWWGLGVIMVGIFMVQNDLANATGFLAILGVIEVLAKGWKYLERKMGGGK